MTKTIKTVNEMTLNEIADLIYANNNIKGFNDEKDTEKWIANQLLNMHGELAELHEAYRSGKENQVCDKTASMVAIGLPILTCEEEEATDLLIRILGFMRHRKINIPESIFAKHSYNITRPHMHEKKN